MDRESELKDGVGNNVQQSLPVVGKYIDDGKAVGRFIVDPHLGRFRSLGQGPRQSSIELRGGSPHRHAPSLSTRRRCDRRRSVGVRPVVRQGSPGRSPERYRPRCRRPSSRICASRICSPLPAMTPVILEKIPGVNSLWVITEYSQVPNGRLKSVSTTTSPWCSRLTAARWAAMRAGTVP